SEHKVDGLLERKGEHIQVYIDGAETPALDVPLQHLFDGSLERFPNPLTGQGIGGFYCYVPIPYTKSCKVVIEGLGGRFYQINYATFPSAEGVKPFSMELSEAERGAMSEAVRFWSEPLAYKLEQALDIHEFSFDYAPETPETAQLSFPIGAANPLLVEGM